MGYVMELRDGRIICPIGLFDVLEVVEEYVGTDVRQYLEEWIAEDRKEPEGDELADALEDYYRTVLENIRDTLETYLREKGNRRKEALAAIKDVLERELK